MPDFFEKWADLHPKTFWLLPLVLAAALRVGALSADLAYDEIWTLVNYAGRGITDIFTDQTLPNNHPLNTLAVKLTAAAGANFALLRLHSWLAGLAAVALLAAAVKPLAGRRAAWWAAVFLACSAPAAVYSQQARGYSLQLAFLALFAAGLSRQGVVRGGKFCYWPEVMVLAGGAGAMLTLSSSAVYLAAIALAGLLIRRKLPVTSMTVALAVGMAAGAVYCGVFFSQFAAARQWGTALSGVGAVPEFMARRMVELVPVAVLLLALAGTVAAFRRTAPLLLSAFLVLFAAVWTNAGASRVYLPLTGFFAAASGIGVAELISAARQKSRLTAKIAAGLALAGAVTGYAALLKSWSFPDWRAAVAEAAQKLPADTLVVYPATATYPIAWNIGAPALDDYLRRLVAPKISALVVFDVPGRVNGMDGGGGEAGIDLPFPGEALKLGGIAARRYQLVPAVEGSVAVALLPPVLPAAYCRELESELAAAFTSLRLNPWLVPELVTADGGHRRGAAFAVRNFSSAKLPPNFRCLTVAEPLPR